jgi:hypothetical protein
MSSAWSAGQSPVRRESDAFAKYMIVAWAVVTIAAVAFLAFIKFH